MENTMVEITNIFSEISEIFKFLDKNLLEKIPQKLRDEINNNKNPNYNFLYDESKTLNEQDIMEETKDMISALYLMYCCDEQSKNEIIRICKKNEEIHQKEIEEKYSYEKLFKNRKEVVTENIQENTEVTDLVVKKEENIFIKIINKIKKFFDWR